MAWYRVVQFVLLALGIMIGASRYPLLSKGSKWYFVLLVVTLITEISAWYLGRSYGNNVIVSWVFLPIQFTLILGGYADELNNYKPALLLCLGLVLLLSIITALLQRQTLFDDYPTLVKAVCNIFIISWNLVYLRSLLNQKTIYSFTDYPLFWISIGWLLFTIITYFGFSAFNFINTKGDKFMSLFLYLRIIANFSLYILIDLALLRKQRTLSITPNGG